MSILSENGYFLFDFIDADTNNHHSLTHNEQGEENPRKQHRSNNTYGRLKA